MTISVISPDMVLNIVQYKIIVIMIMKTVHDLHKHSYSDTHCIPAGGAVPVISLSLSLILLQLFFGRSSCYFLIVKLNPTSVILWSQFVLFPYR